MLARAAFAPGAVYPDHHLLRHRTTCYRRSAGLLHCAHLEPWEMLRHSSSRQLFLSTVSVISRPSRRSSHCFICMLRDPPDHSDSTRQDRCCINYLLGHAPPSPPPNSFFRVEVCYAKELSRLTLHFVFMFYQIFVRFK